MPQHQEDHPAVGPGVDEWHHVCGPCERSSCRPARLVVLAVSFADTEALTAPEPGVPLVEC